MSMDAMEIDSIASPEKKRKDKSESKKRKRQEQASETVVVDDGEKKKKKKKDKHLKKDEKQAVDGGGKGREKEASRKPLSKASSNDKDTHSLSSTADQLPSFHRVTTTLYLPLSPIAISPTHAVSSLLAEHISPLLLTYYPPVRGVVLAYSNPSISATKPTPNATSAHTPNPEPLTLAKTAGEYGVLHTYLTLTFLVFRPERGQTLEGWINVQSEDFLGAIVFNLFSIGIERRRLPADWKWIAPGQQSDRPSTTSASPTSSSKDEEDDDDDEPDSDKENFKPLASNSEASQFEDAASAETGYFQTRSGKRVRGTIRFRVRDVDVIPGSERDKGFLSLEGTMLSKEDEEKLVTEERSKASGAGRAKSGDNYHDPTSTERQEAPDVDIDLDADEDEDVTMTEAVEVQPSSTKEKKRRKREEGEEGEEE
ncbi:TPA_exp: putative RNA polymerase I subunit Rpa43 [Trichophyton benhamiae CBS 112371]|uniref:DNA-directed RNA polymerase subunit n=1 Tax=Arthroderma benhamiae (strain ATCC MYA-4681 / CBS 112371) TaxID=663331 RepID=D4AJZ0_ARTBC|nr:RNA polymerase I subunit Rpa43, putative [Trichophyton benhamiae CBS 112371]EFE37063.1 RNA polymerase I subunit Rpa43, putative [Trichophyton benhamiae CBS 112371]DAA79790.1 TPA_exp: putative RNA polymerase I subunit Rpa43 [Trichophyton benhamiae CBS 112371]